MPPYQTIETERRGDLLIVRQNRPRVLNARNSQMYLELMAAFEAAEADARVAAVLLTSRGHAFCAGMDFNGEPPALAGAPRPGDTDAVARLRATLSPYKPDDATTWLSTRFVRAFIEFSKPLIGAANGPAIGEGFSSLLHCDIVYAADTAYFWAPFARAGAAPEFCSTILMPRRLGHSLANAAIYLARKISAAEAQAAGFVSDIFPGGEGFEQSVVDHVQQGLALAGPPELRAPTLRSFRSLMRSPSDQEQLLQQSDREMAAIAARRASGEASYVQSYYREQLPSSDGQARQR